MGEEENLYSSLQMALIFLINPGDGYLHRMRRKVCRITEQLCVCGFFVFFFFPYHTVSFLLGILRAFGFPFVELPMPQCLWCAT